MELKKKPAYNGYQAYEYLEEGVDYPKFDWARWDWAGRHVVELNAEQEARVAELLAKYPTITPPCSPRTYTQRRTFSMSCETAVR